jgi:hypothetical protein
MVNAASVAGGGTIDLKHIFFTFRAIGLSMTTILHCVVSGMELFFDIFAGINQRRE